MQKQLAVVAKNAIQQVQHHSPAVLTGIAVAGVASTAYLTARAAVEAERRLEGYSDWVIADDDNGHHPTKVEKLKLVWTIYIPPVVSGLATAACIIGAQSINTRRQAALVGAFTVTEGAFQEYKEKVAESLTKPQKEKLETAINQKYVDENPPASELLASKDGKVLILDKFTGRYFRNTQEAVRRAQNDINERLTSGGELYVSLNEFYALLGLEDSEMGTVLGFNSDRLIDLVFDTSVAGEGVPCLTIAFRLTPFEGYTSLR